jgi:chromosome partitioning protein
MSWVVSVGGQKGGTGKSTVAQGLVVEAVKNGTIAILADMDLGQQSSLHWGERRRAAGVLPSIDVRLLRAVAGIAPLRRLCDLLVIDTPGRADQNTLKLVQASDLMVVCSDTNAVELEPTVTLLHDLKAAGLADGRAVIALTKVLDERREREARAYLAKAGMQALPVALRFHPLSHDIGNEGRAVTEARQKAVAEPAREFFAAIASALEKTQERARQTEREEDRQMNREQDRER